MANAIASRLGQVNATGDDRALFLKVFGGEVLSAFNRTSAFRQRHMVRVIASGKSAQFPVTGLITGGYHTPGTEITGQTVKANERIITIGDLLLASAFIANIDEAMNHYDVRGIYSDEIGDFLGRQYDQNVARTGILNARSAAIVDGLQGGSQLTDAAMATDGTKLWQAIFNSGVLLDQKDIPMADRSTFIRPVQYALVVQSEKPINRDINVNQDNGSIAMGNVNRINNIELVKTNNLVFSDDRTNQAVPVDQRGDFSTTQFLTQHRNAVGTVQLQDVTMESDYDIRRQGTLMLGKYLVGHGKLRPESGVEGRTAAPAA